MKNVEILLFAMILFADASGQCKEVRYNVRSSMDYSISDSLIFSARNYCQKNKYVLFSLEYKDSTGWQEVDNDIFTAAVKGMKIIKLPPGYSQRFSFKVSSIDPIFFSAKNEKANFRIVANLYSDDKIQIIQTKIVKRIFVGTRHSE